MTLRFESLRRSIGLCAFAALAAVNCSSSTDSPPAVATTHPAGTITDTALIAGSAHGIAIANDGTMLITRLDSTDLEMGRDSVFALGPKISVGAHPIDVAITPDSRTAFVPLIFSPHVAIVDVASGTKTGELTVAESPLRVLVSPNNRHLYVTTSGAGADTTSTVYDFDPRTYALLDTIVVGAFANGIVFDAPRNRLYVSATGYVYEIDTATDSVLRRIWVGGPLQDVAVKKDGSELWVATETDAGVQVFSLPDGAHIQSIDGTENAVGLKITPDGAQFYVARDIGGILAIVDASSRQVVSSLEPGLGPIRIAFNATGSRAVVTDDATGAVLIQ
jgi:DNA-binding beta-propeller fold protein YncE